VQATKQSRLFCKEDFWIAARLNGARNDNFFMSLNFLPKQAWTRSIGGGAGEAGMARDGGA